SGPIYSEVLEIDGEGTPSSIVPNLLREGAGGSLIWTGREFVNLHAAGRDLFALQPLDLHGQPRGAAATVVVRAALVSRAHFVGGEIWIPYQTATDDRPVKHIVRVGASTARFQLGERGEQYGWAEMAMATNAAGETVIAVQERRPDASGVHSQRAVIYTEADLLPLFCRRRAAGR
ncbi:MAG: hypothetical protein ABIO78_08025, partial [Thermoanaerobaculia bacterium]